MHRLHPCIWIAAENQIDAGSAKGFFRTLLNRLPDADTV